MASHGCGLALMRSMTSSSVKCNQAVQEHLVNQEKNAKRVTFHQALVTAGFVKQIKKRPPEQQLIQVEGEPISRTIVEKRR
jgi:ferredoxin-NADP reductase